MIDFHTHILPGMDDGSKNTEQSLAMLRLLAEQGVDTVIATPHFCADDESVDSFLQRRAAADRLLREAASDLTLRILLGAEVLYYPGISRMAQLHRLCIGEGKLLLLEMPFAAWRESVIREVLEIVATGCVTVVIAHIDRYMRFVPASVWERLVAGGVLLQANAEFFLKRTTRRRALSMLRRGMIAQIGSDCHDLALRAPNIGRVRSLLVKKLGNWGLDAWSENAAAMLQYREEANIILK